MKIEKDATKFVGLMIKAMTVMNRGGIEEKDKKEINKLINEMSKEKEAPKDMPEFTQNIADLVFSISRMRKERSSATKEEKEVRDALKNISKSVLTRIENGFFDTKESIKNLLNEFDLADEEMSKDFIDRSKDWFSKL